MVEFAPDEDFRSLQLYGVDPDVTAAAVRMVGEDGLADHVDLNFGCPKLADCKTALVSNAIKRFSKCSPKGGAMVVTTKPADGSLRVRS
jgi:hypothetical protein